jgi:outer membrane receptor protein involved in Fe transport
MNSPTGFRTSLQLTSAIALTLVAVASSAQQATPPTPGGVEVSTSGLEVVEVTARKYEESAQSVPVSLTALSGNALEQRAVLNVTDLQTNVPGLLVTLNSQGGAPTFAIRAAKADNGTADTVTAYVDDVPVATTRAIANMMYDMQSISTLKGPQGTLFGANSTGGAIIFRPNRPTNEFEGYLQAGYGNWNRIDAEAMINIPLGETFAARLAGNYIKRDGYVKNATPVNGNDELSDLDQQSARLSLRWKPGDRFTNDLSFEYYKQDSQTYAETVVGLRDRYDYTTFLGGLVLPVDYALAGVTLGQFDREHSSIGPKPTWDQADILSVIESASFDFSDNTSGKLVVGYQNDDLDTAQDNDATIFAGVNGRTRHQIELLTVEPSLDTKWMDGRFRNKTGLFYSTQSKETGNSYRVIGLPWDFTAFGGPSSPLAGLVNSFYPIQSNSNYWRDTDSKAIYTQFAYDVTDALTATLGLRYTKDHGDYTASNRLGFGTASDPSWGEFLTVTGFSTAPGALPEGCSGALAGYDNFDPAKCRGHANFDTSSVNYNLTLDYKVSPTTMIYASTRSGYIAGGFNNQAVPAATGIPIVFQPEKVTDFEFGLKSDWELAGHPIRTNIAGFYGNYKDQQRVQNGTTAAGITFIGVVNAGASTYYGLDLEVVYELSDMFTASVGWNLVKSEYTNFKAILNIPGQFAYIDLQGEPMAQTPENVVTAALTANWTENFSSTLSAFYRDPTLGKDSPTVAGTLKADGELDTIDPARDFREFDKLQSFTLLNFTTSWKHMFGSNLDANVWVKNLTDEKYNVANSNQMLQYGYATYWWGTPREYGLELRYSF